VTDTLSSGANDRMADKSSGSAGPPSKRLKQSLLAFSRSVAVEDEEAPSTAGHIAGEDHEDHEDREEDGISETSEDEVSTECSTRVSVTKSYIR